MPEIERKKQISKIWAIANNLGINSEYLHVLVYSITQLESIAELNIQQLNKVAEHLKREQAKQNMNNAKSEKGKNVFQLPTPAQKYLLSKTILEVQSILALNDISAYLKSISNRMFGKGIEKLNRGQFGNLIKQLKLVSNKKNQIAS